MFTRHFFKQEGVIERLEQPVTFFEWIAMGTLFLVGNLSPKNANFPFCAFRLLCCLLGAVDNRLRLITI